MSVIKSKVYIYRQMAELLSAGIPVQQVLTILNNQSDERLLIRQINRANTYIKSGLPVMMACTESQFITNPLYLGLIEIGEKTGSMSESFHTIANMEEEWGTLKRQIWQAVTYPLVVLVMALLSMLILMVFVIPTFKEAFLGFQVDLPFITSLLFSIHGLLTMNALPILAILTLISFSLFLLLKITGFQKIVMKYFQFIPFISQIFRLFQNYRLCIALSILLEKGISLLHAFQLLEKQETQSSGIKDDFQLIIHRLSGGQPLTAILPQIKWILPETRNMVLTGEENANLARMLAKAAGIIKNRLETRLKLLSTLLEPILIVVVGCVVALMLFAIYLPLFDSMTHLGGLQ